ncbi:Calnexin [Phytophthora cinnamomi]|uniref:Calnexin n=1 Tax=Phytophthora cinnamomi TaxID=4785 RepID=UPI00355A9917|nr:Calnexin [Phytophthora cinnamomi]
MKVKTVVALLSALLLPMAALGEEEAQQQEAQQQTQQAAERRQQAQELTKHALFAETFEAEELFDGSRWFKSSHEKYSSQDVVVGEVTLQAAHLTPDRGLVLDKPARHYGLAVKLDEPLRVDGSDTRKEMVVQYEVKLQKGLDCGGAYVKLLRQDQDKQDYSAFSDSTPFVLMFGPDKCGKSDKVHLIFQHKNPVSGEYEEKHMMEAPGIKSDKDSHLYTAVIRDDNTFEVFVDQKSVKSGSLLENFLPSVIPEKEIDDPEDSKPEDWVDEKKIRDPNAVKPDDWDEDAPARIPDEDAVKPADWLDNEPTVIEDPDVAKPEDWDDEDDGDFIVPQIPNPKCAEVSGCGEWKRPTKTNPAYKGKFYAPYIPNPAYKGEWKPRKIANPNYFEDKHPARMDPIGALAVEVWTMTEGITFDNFWLGNDLNKAQEFAELTWAPKHAAEVEATEKAKKAKESAEDGEEGVMKTLETLATDFATYANANPVIAIGSVAGVSVLVTLGFFFLCCASGSSKPAATKKADSGAEDDAQQEEEDAKAIDSDGKDQKIRQRKKAPKAE